MDNDKIYSIEDTEAVEGGKREIEFRLPKFKLGDIVITHAWRQNVLTDYPVQTKITKATFEDDTWFYEVEEPEGVKINNSFMIESELFKLN